MTPTQTHPSPHARTPQRRAGFNIRTLDGEAVLYDVGQHAVYYLNDAALALWSQSDGQTSLTTAFSELHGDDAEVADYVDSAVDTMIDAGLLERELPIHA